MWVFIAAYTRPHSALEASSNVNSKTGPSQSGNCWYWNVGKIRVHLRCVVLFAALRVLRRRLDAAGRLHLSLHRVTHPCLSKKGSVEPVNCLGIIETERENTSITTNRSKRRGRYAQVQNALLVCHIALQQQLRYESLGRKRIRKPINRSKSHSSCSGPDREASSQATRETQPQGISSCTPTGDSEEVKMYYHVYGKKTPLCRILRYLRSVVDSAGE